MTITQLFTLVGVLVGISSGSSCSVTFFWDAGYGGASFTLSPGQGRADLVNYGWNDQISGLMFNTGTDGTSCVATVCWDIYCGQSSTDFTWGEQYGNGQDYIDNTPYVGDYANDQFSAVYVFSYSANTDSWAMLYKSCQGTEDYSWFVTPSEINNAQLSIFMYQLEYDHIGNDALSMVVLSPFAAGIFYVNDQLEGPSTLISGEIEVPCLTSYQGSNWNDMISSIQFYDLTSGGGFPNPTGYWVEKMSGSYQEPLSYSVTYGYTTTDTTSTSSSFTTQLTTSIEAGVNFEGIGSSKVTVSASVSSTIASSVSNAITASTTITCLAQCLANTCESGITFLYTWEMVFNRPWDPSQIEQTTLSSCNFVCTCGNPPACPLGACSNSVCSVCLPYKA